MPLIISTAWNYREQLSLDPSSNHNVNFQNLPYAIWHSVPSTTNIRIPDTHERAYVIVTENKLDHWHKMFEGYLESPHQSLRNMSHWCNGKYRLGVMICVMVVNYCHITPDIVYGCISHRNVLSIGEHAHLETAFNECDMQEANKGSHSLDYNFGYLHPSYRHHFEERMSHAIKTSRSTLEKRVKSSYTQVK